MLLLAILVVFPHGMLRRSGDMTAQTARRPARAPAAGQLAIAVLVAAALVPVFGGAYLTTFLFTLLSAYIVAQSWDWLHGEAGYVNLGHYIYFGIGAYAFALANVNGLPVVVSFLVAALFTGLAAALLELSAVPAARRLFRIRHARAAAAVRALGDEPHGDHARRRRHPAAAGHRDDRRHRRQDVRLLRRARRLRRGVRREHLDEPIAVRLSRSRRSATTSRRPRWSASASFRSSSRRWRSARWRRRSPAAPISGRSATSIRARCSGSTSRSFRWRWRCSAAPACCGAR